ncbi:MAG TPA: N-acetylmuramoyl-L-alanine amidase [Longimicrobium sp.]|nr:N-acetylmuramoyl-L-alanine amidase [Longimicrobium sp.]
MIRGRPVLLLLVAALSSHNSSLASQPARAAWRLDGGRAPVEVREEATHGYPALPVSALVSLGAELAYAGGSVVARFGQVETRFTPGSAEIIVAGRAQTLSHPVYSDGGITFVPAEFFARFLGDASRGTLAVSADQRTVRKLAEVPADAPAAVAVAAPEPQRPQIVQASVQRPAVRRLVVVDAGHGGRDPGARGPGGTREKDVTLRVARMVAELLRQDPTLEVRMTRDRDTLIALHDRARFANRWRDEGQPAVFISIHCNANPSRSEKGYETYFLSEARTADARRVEAFENASVQYEEHAAARDAMGFILTDLRQNHYLRESSEWAQMIQDHLRAIHPGPNRGVKQAGFAVLRGTFMPSVLVEIGFVSNHNEERLLIDEHMQTSIARQLAESVRSYFNRSGVRPASE